MKDVKPLLLLLLSVGLVGTWVYHLYDKNQYSHRRTEVLVKDSAAVADGVRDSLTKLYGATIRDLDQQLGASKTNADSLRNSSDKLKVNLQAKLGEINKLRTEISSILKNGKTTPAELSQAREKIRELQNRVDELRTQNSSLQEEKTRLNGILTQLTDEVKKMEQSILKLDAENKEMTAKINLASTFVASELKFAAVDVRGSREQETSQARKADAFSGSFVLQNNISNYQGTAVMIAIAKPDGTLLQTTEGIADSQKDGINYTKKMILDYQKGDHKKMDFVVNAANIDKGNYTMQLWHNGVLIGQVVKKLN